MGAIHGDHHAVSEILGCRAGADDAGDAQFASDDGGVAGHASGVGDQCGGTAAGR